MFYLDFANQAFKKGQKKDKKRTKKRQKKDKKKTKKRQKKDKKKTCLFNSLW